MTYIEKIAETKNVNDSAKCLRDCLQQAVSEIAAIQFSLASNGRDFTSEEQNTLIAILGTYRKMYMDIVRLHMDSAIIYSSIPVEILELPIPQQ